MQGRFLHPSSYAHLLVATLADGHTLISYCVLPAQAGIYCFYSKIASANTFGVAVRELLTHLFSSVISLGKDLFKTKKHIRDT